MKIFRSANAVQGAVDQVSVRGVHGWCFSSRSVGIRVNGRDYFSAFCHLERRDVQAALGIEEYVGFNAPLNLLPGDIVEVVTPFCQPLPGSPQLVGANEWLPVSACCNSAFAPLVEFLKHSGASHFKPFFKRKSGFSAVALRNASEPELLVKLATTPTHVADIHLFYKQVIEPYALPAPALVPVSHTSLSGGHLIYRYIEGYSLSAASLLSEDNRVCVINALEKLHNVPGGQLKRMNTQQPYWVYLRKTVLRQALLTFDVGHNRLIFAMLRCINRLPCVLSHGDLHAGNVLVNSESDEIALIDWDRWGLLPIGYDEACFLRGLPFKKALNYLPEKYNLRLGFTIISFWLGLAQNSQFRSTLKAEEMVQYFKGAM